MLKDRSKQHKVNQDTYAVVMARLIRWPSDCHQLAADSGLSLTTTQDLMRAFKRRGVVFIAGWRPDSRDRDVTAVFALRLKGTETDVPRRKQTRAEIAARHRAKKAAETPTPTFADDPMMGALFGARRLSE